MLKRERLEPNYDNIFEDFYIGKTRHRLHDRKIEHFKVLTKSSHSSAIADYIISTGHNIKWDHFQILVTRR